MKQFFTMMTIILTLSVITKAQLKSPSEDRMNPADTNAVFININLFNTEATYVGDFAGNLLGGFRKGATYLGIANLKIGFETGKLGIWDNGEFLIHGAATHGGIPSGDLIGDFQVASNIEAGNHIYIQELWYKQLIGKTEITIGLQDLNAQFLASEYGGTFMNSSFGVPSLISDNVPVPIFPLTTLGISGKYQFNETISVKAALFDGLPEVFENNQYNTNWSLSSENGVLFFSEVQLSADIKGLPGIFKAGGYYHTHLKELSERTGKDETVFNNNYGFYFLADQLIWRKNENQGLGLFLQFAVSPANINTHNYYIGGGISYYGVSGEAGEELIGIAFAHAGFNKSAFGDETTLECFYKTKVTGNLYIQPDFQYIINPAGTDNKLSNALAAFIRFGIDF